jgi:TRAP-type mannitol/chloroaromatic compound transport system permease small subunit
MTEPSPALLRTIRAIDGFSAWSGKAVAWLILPLVLGLTYE